MTRINCVPPSELSREHLIAEYREILRIEGYVTRWLNAKNPSKIPPTYRMGKGHVAFFYNKLTWVENRFWALVDEMWKRGYSPTIVMELGSLPKHLFNDWMVTPEALTINRQRIAERNG